jgi:hypothetical protein
MDQVTLSSALTFIGTVLEAGLLIVLLRRRLAASLWGVVIYLLTTVSVGIVRSYTVEKYGFASAQYGDCYWKTDLLLVLAAFVLVTSFFRRACSDNHRMWEYLRMLLGTVFLLAALISFFSLAGHDGRIFSFFIVEFSQNLYFACLVLTTLLYLLTLKMEIADERLGLLVCGLGIEFAGPAACLAFYYLTGGNVGSSLGVYLFPLFDAGMILTWFYAVSRVPETAKAGRTAVQPHRLFAEGSVSHS